MSDQEESCIIENSEACAMTSEEKPTEAMQIDTDEHKTKEETSSKNEFVSRLAEYEELFKNRYTSTDPAYMERVESKLQPLIIHPFGGRDQQQQQQPWQNRRDDGRRFGGQRGGHRDYNGQHRRGGDRWERGR